MREILIIFQFFFPYILFAHDIWIEYNDGNFKLFYGHKFSSHNGEKQIQYNPEWVKEVICFKNNRHEKLLHNLSYPLVVKEDCDILIVTLSSGYWTKTVYGTKNVPKINEKNVIKSWLSIESVKYIKNLSVKKQDPVTDGFEIVPISDISKIKKGDKITIRVFYQGKPQKDVVVSYNDKPRGTTDDDGYINITLKETGLQSISATYREKLNDQNADEKIITTTLNFVLLGE